MPPEFGFDLNGRPVTARDPTARLSQVLRDLGARDVKIGCSAGDCGACTVLVDGAPVCACLMAAGQARGTRVETQAGLVAQDPLGQRLGLSFQRHHAAQCGFCTPGMMVSAVALLRRTPAPTEAEVAEALAGVLCRCTGYRSILTAVQDSATTPLPDPGGVGASAPRLDGAAKVAGTEIFGDDTLPEGTTPGAALHLRAIRSPHHHARFAFGDLAGYAAAHGVRVLTAADVPGVNCHGVIPGFEDQPLIAETVARFRGEVVACVIGPRDLLEALPPFPVTWEPLPHALTPEAASDLPDLHPGRPGNVMTTGRVRRGDAEAALGRAEHVVSGRFSTGFVEHAPLEPEAASARRIGNRIEVTCSTQAPFMNRDGVAHLLGLAPEQVRILPVATGGGFGTKLDLSAQPLVALAAWITGAPVRMAYSRAESIAATTKRHPAEITMTIGCDETGRITGARFDGTFNTGAYASWGPTVASRVPIHASGPYLTPAWEGTARAIHTHCAPSGAFRGFGVPQAALAQEQLYDELAAALGMDRLEFRLLNCLRPGAPTVTGQVFDAGIGIAECLEALRPRWQEACAWARAAPLRGVGLAAGWYGCGNTGLPNPSTIRAGVRPDGTICLHQGAVDIGQGSNTVITQIFAGALGVAPGVVRLIGADTDQTPDAGKTSASRQTFVTGNAARAAGAALRALILRRGNVSDAATIRPGPGGLTLLDGGKTHVLNLTPGGGDRGTGDRGTGAAGTPYALEVCESYDPPTVPLDRDGQGAPYAIFGTAAQMVTLELDPALGTVRLERVVAAHDVGRAINPALARGQVEGGVAQGLGMALMEEFLPGRTENLHDYLIPTIGDIPPIETLLIETGDPHGPHGAKGLGEHSLIPTAPAILNAIAHATGRRLHRVPATPDRVQAALRERLS